MSGNVIQMSGQVIRRLGFKCSWWHRRQANDVVASEPSIFSENHDYNSFSVSR